MNPKNSIVDFCLKNPYDDIINGNIHLPDAASAPVVVILHGYKGSKDWGFYPYIAQKITANGAIALRFNFSLNGTGSSSYIVTNPSAFARNTISRQIEDLFIISNSLASSKEAAFQSARAIWNGKLIILGHSLGAATALLAAAKGLKVDKIIAWASMGMFNRYTPHQKKLWKNIGKLEFTDSNTGNSLYLFYSFLEDIESNDWDGVLKKYIANPPQPVLFIHGDADFTIPLPEIQALLSVSDRQLVHLDVIPRCNHTFGSDDDFSEATPALVSALNRTFAFIGVNFPIV